MEQRGEWRTRRVRDRALDEVVGLPTAVYTSSKSWAVVIPVEAWSWLNEFLSLSIFGISCAEW